MGKIRVQDLARMMGLANQDLLFKLKSIGVRVEGDDAHIDTDVIQAILQGKRLPQPREVILRDQADESVPARTPRRPQQPLRSTRRSMIQRVDSRIRTIQVRDRPHGEEAADTALADDAVEIAAGTEVKVADPAAPREAEVQEPATEAPAEKVAEAQPAAAPEAAEEAEEKVASKPVKTAAEPPAEAPRKAPEKAAAEPARKAPEKAARKIADGSDKLPPEPTAAQRRLAKSLEPRAKIISMPSEPVAPQTQPIGPRRGRPSPPRQPPGRSRRGAGGRSGRGVAHQRRGPITPSEPVEQMKPVSERGKRRAQRREEAGDQPTGLISFKEDRPEGPVTISEGMTVREFAEKLGVKAKDLIKTLVSRGVMANINHVLDLETASQLAEEMGVEVMQVSFEEEVQLQQETVRTEEGEDLEKAGRAPVVTVMGHVDHGKTTLLDVIRETNVAEGEAGGITQHIGAYHVDVGGRQIVFLDTPGHEAFTLMRARGAKVTDIVVLVVAADDGVMPQTIEAIDHAKAAEVPIVIAINKIDKANANPDRVKKELADLGLMVEDWGGDTVAVPISALKREGVSELLEMILLTSDILELQATPDLPAQGTVLEARKDVGRGIVATILVQDGTLEVGDTFVTGATWGKVRSMIDDRGERIKEAGPSTPVEVTGFNDLPSAGDTMQVVEDESKARGIADFRSREERSRELAGAPQRLSLSQLFSQIEKGETKELPVVIKADVHGSIEVLKETLPKLSTEKVKVKVIHSAVGAISTNDVILASASEALIIGFNVRPERNAAALAEKEEVEIRLHTVIYELADELRAAMTGLLEPTFEEVEKGRAEVRDTFKVPKVGVIAGCHIVEGVIPRNALVRLLRDNVVVYEGKIASLRRFKDDVSEVRSGFDCGIGLVNFQDVKPGDEIEAYAREEVAPTL